MSCNIMNCYFQCCLTDMLCFMLTNHIRSYGQIKLVVFIQYNIIKLDRVKVLKLNFPNQLNYLVLMTQTENKRELIVK